MNQSQAAVGAVDQRHQPRFGALAARSLAVTDIQLPEPAQLPPHVVQVEHPGLVDPQVPRRPPAGRRRSCGRSGRTCGRSTSSSRHPANSCSTSSAVGGMRSCGSTDARGRLISSSGHSTTRPVRLCSSTLCRSSRNWKYTVKRGRAAGPRRRVRVAQHLAEIGVGVGGLHLPQRPAEPVPNQLEMIHVVADRGVDQSGRGPGQYEPGQHVGLEVGELLLGRRSPQFSAGRAPPPEPTHASSTSLAVKNHQPGRNPIGSDDATSAA